MFRAIASILVTCGVLLFCTEAKANCRGHQAGCQGHQAGCQGHQAGCQGHQAGCHGLFGRGLIFHRHKKASYTYVQPVEKKIQLPQPMPTTKAEAEKYSTQNFATEPKYYLLCGPNGCTILKE